MNMKKNINEEIERIKHIMGLNEEDNLGVFDNFPPELLKLLEDNYSHMYRFKYDYNDKADRFINRETGEYDGKGFNKWFEENTADEFVKNKARIITAIRSDLITLKRRKIAKLKLDAYEELIIPLFGYHITGEALTKFQEDVLLDPNATPASIQRGFEEARNIIDQYGNINQRKIEKSTVFPGGEVNYPTFERFVEEKPKYRSTFETWKSLLDEYHKQDMKELNAFRVYNDHETFKKLRLLYDFLTSNKKEDK
jgi:hypothetical protein